MTRAIASETDISLVVGIELVDMDDNTLSLALARSKEIKEEIGEEWKEEYPMTTFG
jgi:hypothetical protein